MNKNKRRKIRTELKMNKCFYCKKKPPEVKLTIDHKEPVSKGGTDELKNLQCLCEHCNKMKSSVSHVEVRRIVKWWLDMNKFEHDKKMRPIKHEN